MSRARNIKPGFFKNELLVELPFEYRLLFIGVWTMADRDGRFEDRPTKIRMELFPADAVDVNAGLQALHDNGFIERYDVDGKRFCRVVEWAKHQNPHMKEAASSIPAPCKHGASTVQAPDEHGSSPADSSLLIPDSGFLTTDSGFTDKPAKLASRFDEFWAAYPIKTGRKQCLTKWNAAGLDAIADEIVADVTAKQAKDRRWHEGFIPNPQTYINQERWLDPVQPIVRSGGLAVVGGAGNRQQQLEDRNKRVADEWLAKQSSASQRPL